MEERKKIKIEVSPECWEYINGLRRARETMGGCLARLMGLDVVYEVSKEEVK